MIVEQVVISGVGGSCGALANYGREFIGVYGKFSTTYVPSDVVMPLRCYATGGNFAIFEPVKKGVIVPEAGLYFISFSCADVMPFFVQLVAHVNSCMATSSVVVSEGGVSTLTATVYLEKSDLVQFCVQHRACAVFSFAPVVDGRDVSAFAVYKI